MRNGSSCFLGGEEVCPKRLPGHRLYTALTVYVFIPQVMSWHKGIPQQNSEIEGKKKRTLTAVDSIYRSLSEGIFH